jgi:hypothetical protein
MAPARLTDADDLPIGLIDVELSKPPTELVGDTAVVLLRPGEGPPAAVLKVGPIAVQQLTQLLSHRRP